MASRFVRALARKKTEDMEEGSKLARVLNLVDLTALGVGSTLGLGVYVLAGSVARNEAGPAVCLSFLVAAIASAVAGLCYAEFASRVPKAGSAYIYSYVSVGEFAAFIIGWNLILEYVIGTASVARGLSNYVDALAGNTMKRTLTELFPIDINFLSPYPDFLSFFVVMMLTVLLAIGVKESTTLNNIFTVLNLITVGVVFIAGTIKADVGNWKIEKKDIPENVKHAGEGGFLPFGYAGVMAGAAKCFYGFVGFDAVATTGEEAKNPQKNIPIAIIISLVIIFFAYFGISTVLTMMWPYYDQNPDAPFPYVFEKIGWPVIKWIVTVGAVFALCTSMLGAMFPLPRVIYAMSKDGLLFKFLASVNPKTQTPLIATVLSGLLAGIMATIFDLQQLVDMMSIGTLLAYTIVAICVLILRYTPDDNEIEMKQTNLEISIFNFVRHLFNLNMNKFPTTFSSAVINWAVSVFCVLSGAFCGIIIYSNVFEDAYSIIGFSAIVIALIAVGVIIYRQPTADVQKLAFKVPCVPLIPMLSILINLYLMLELDSHTWIRFSVWLFIGFLIYFLYGIQHSEERDSSEKNTTGKRLSSAATASVHSEENHERTKEITKF